jgi:Ca2+-dependent lipid-binding protein
VKVTILQGCKKVKKKKTSTKRNTTNPTWNEALVFNLAKGSLHTTSIELLVYSDNLLGNNDHLGRLLVGPNTSGEELAHWHDLINAKTAMARWHSLRPPHF